MASWFQRLFSRPASAPAGASEPPLPAAPPERRRSEESPAPPTPGPGFGAKRPLLDSEGRLAGFEFSVGELTAQRLRRSGDLVAFGAQAVALLAAMKPTLASGRLALTAMPLAVFGRPQVLSLVPAGAMLALTDRPFGDPAQQPLLGALARKGAFLGAPMGVISRPLSEARFVVIDAQGLDGPALQAAATAWRRTAAQPITLIASGVGSLDDLEHALKHGFDLASGLMERKPGVRDAASLPPRLRRVSELLNLIMQSADTADIAAELRNDTLLTHDLLRHANGPLIGLNGRVEAVDQAVILLGREALYRWLSMHLLAGASGRATSRALQEVALARARLLELLAPAVGGPPSALFTTGMLSLLDTMLGVPMVVALEPLYLAAPAREALLEQSGPWHPLLALARALERNDHQRAHALAADLGGFAAVTAAADEAWHWASAAAAELHLS